MTKNRDPPWSPKDTCSLSFNHHKCSRLRCNHLNPPQSVPGTYQCSSCHKGTYVVTFSQAARIHAQAQRAFGWHEERRKEGEKKREDVERIQEERCIAKYLASDEEMWQRAMELKRQEEEEVVEKKSRVEGKKLTKLEAERMRRRAVFETKPPEWEVQEPKMPQSMRQETIPTCASWKSHWEAFQPEETTRRTADFRSRRAHRREEVVVMEKEQLYTFARVTRRLLKKRGMFGRRASISTFVQFENFDITSTASSTSTYCQPSFVKRDHEKAPLPRRIMKAFFSSLLRCFKPH